MPRKSLPKMLKVKDVAKKFGVSRQTIYEWRKNGLLPSFNIGRSVYFNPDEVQKRIEESLTENTV